MTQPFEYRLSTHEKARLFDLADGRLKLWARSGLNASESELLKQSSGWKAAERVLVIENRSGLLGAFYQHLYPDAKVEFFAMDCFYSERLRANLAAHHLERQFEIHLGPDLPHAPESEGQDDQEGVYDEVFLQVSQSLSAEMVADYLQQIHQVLKVGGRCWLGAEKRHKGSMSQMKKVFGSLTEHSSKHGLVYVSKKSGPLKKQKDYSAEFELRLTEHLNIKAMTRPGVFSHRRADGGALALIETVTVEDQDDLLEMGCGCGVVALGLQKRYGCRSVSLLDSHTRALQVSVLNAEKNALPEPKIQCSSQGWQGDEQFDVFVGNPPYFGDHQISALFMDTAARVLKKGGVMWIVAKTMDWNWEYAQTQFKNMTLHSRRGYQVMRCEKA